MRRGGWAPGAYEAEGSWGQDSRKRELRFPAGAF